MTTQEALEQINQIYKEARRLPCSCWSYPEGPCRFCNALMRAPVKVQEIVDELCESLSNAEY